MDRNATDAVQMPEVILRRTVRELIETFDFDRKQLDVDRLKKLKRLIRDNEEMLIEKLITLLFAQLRRDDGCERRLAILLIVDQLFNRSHRFRLSFIEDLQDFLLYTAETDPLRYPLPDASSVASKTLKIETIRIVRLWCEKYSGAYSKLVMADAYLKTSKTMDYERANAESMAERQRIADELQRKDAIRIKVTANIDKQYGLMKDDICRCLTECRSTVELLYPKFCSIDEHLSTEDDNGNYQVCVQVFYYDLYLQLHGITNAEQNLTISLNTNMPIVTATDDNATLIESLVDSTKMLEYYLRMVKQWLTRLAKYDCNNQLTKYLIDIKSEIEIELDRCRELNVIKNTHKNDDRAALSDDDFEDVPDEKEGLELNFNSTIPDDRIPQHILDRINQMEDDDKPGPSGIKSNNTSMNNDEQNKISTNSRYATVPFGLDLKYWGEKRHEAASIPKNNADCHRFWKPVDESDGITGIDAIYQSRVITFAGKFTPIERQCRHPLVDGRLCTRKDMIKCPFHGVIIDRDQFGNQLAPIFSSSNSQKQEIKQSIDSNRIFGDDQFVRDVESVTGVNLKSISNRRKQTIVKRKSKNTNQSRDRLSNKVFNKRAIARVTATLDAVQKAKNNKQFDQQFAYTMSSRLC